MSCLIFSEPRFYTLVKGVDDHFGIEFYSRGNIRNIVAGSPVDQHGLKESDYLFSINKVNVIGEPKEVLESLLQKSGSTVEIGVLKPKEFDPNLREY